MPDYKLVTNPQELDAMISSITTGNKILAADTETTSLHVRNGKLRLVQLNDSENTYLVDCFRFDSYGQLDKLGRVLADKNIKSIWQNFKFDYAFIFKYLGHRVRESFFDTYLADVLIDFPAGHKLSDIARRYLDISLDKTEQVSDWSGELTESQLQYASDDVLHLHKIREIQLAKLQETGQLKAAKLEFDALPAISEMEINGFAVNYEKYAQYVENNKKTRDQKEKALLEFLQTRGGKRALPKQLMQESIFGDLLPVKSKNDINVASWQQVLPIYREMGIPIESTDQKVISPLLNQYPDLKYLIEHREWAKLCSAFGESFLAKIENGRIYSDIMQCGAVTLRLSGRNPNLMQLPNTKECRSCFSPQEGRKLAVADYSGYELRILADISNDQVMLDAFNTGKDLHSMTAASVFGIPYEEAKTKYKEQRQAAKIGNFSIIYGINPVALMNRLKADGVDADEELAKKIIDGFYGTYENARKWLFGQERLVLRDNKLRGFAGHLMNVQLIRGDKRSERSAGRDARNWPIQNLNAVSTKRAMKLIQDEFISRGYEDSFLTLPVHDELISEAPENRVDDIKNIVKRGMETAGEEYLKKVKVIAEAQVCSNWGEKG